MPISAEVQVALLQKRFDALETAIKTRLSQASSAERVVHGKDAVLDYTIVRGYVTELVAERTDKLPDQFKALIIEKVVSAVEEIPKPKDGEPGKDVDMDVVKQLVDNAAKFYVRQIPIPQNGKDGARGKDGVGIQGPVGPKGDRGPMGPMPRHEWKGTSLRFELEPGVWGEFVNLEGPIGPAGRSKRGGGGAGSSTGTSVVYGYFPMGWT